MSYMSGAGGYLHRTEVLILGSNENPGRERFADILQQELPYCSLVRVDPPHYLVCYPAPGEGVILPPSRVRVTRALPLYNLPDTVLLDILSQEI